MGIAQIIACTKAQKEFQAIVDVIERVDQRFMARDGPVSMVCDEITNQELRLIYFAAKRGLRAMKPAVPSETPAVPSTSADLRPSRGTESSVGLGPDYAGRLKAAFGRLVDLVEDQAEDEGLWFEATRAPEAYLQQHLRLLHSAIEQIWDDPLHIIGLHAMPGAAHQQGASEKP